MHFSYTKLQLIDIFKLILKLFDNKQILYEKNCISNRCNIGNW